MKRFPLHRRTRLIARDLRCPCCGLPACIQFGIGGSCYCSGCAVKLVRRRKGKEGSVRASTRTGSSA